MLENSKNTYGAETLIIATNKTSHGPIIGGPKTPKNHPRATRQTAVEAAQQKTSETAKTEPCIVHAKPDSSKPAAPQPKQPSPSTFQTVSRIPAPLIKQTR